MVADGSAVRKVQLPPAVNDISLGFGTAKQPTIYATSEEGIFVSTDGGANFNKRSLPGTGGKVRAVATSFHHPETAYVSYDHLSLEGKTWIGVAKTTILAPTGNWFGKTHPRRQIPLAMSAMHGSPSGSAQGGERIPST